MSSDNPFEADLFRPAPPAAVNPVKAAEAAQAKARAAARMISTPAANDAAALVPRDLVVRVGKLTGFAIYYEDGVPLYKERLANDHEVEVEFILPHVAMKMLTGAPNLDLRRDHLGYTCVLKAGVAPQQAPTLVEAVFKAFAAAKAHPKAA